MAEAATGRELPVVGVGVRPIHSAAAVAPTAKAALSVVRGIKAKIRYRSDAACDTAEGAATREACWPARPTREGSPWSGFQLTRTCVCRRTGGCTSMTSEPDG
eukprot:scaffold228181_cov30-Tisochrysis_lutea.AAC.2